MEPLINASERQVSREEQASRPTPLGIVKDAFTCGLKATHEACVIISRSTMGSRAILVGLIVSCPADENDFCIGFDDPPLSKTFAGEENMAPA